MLSAKNGFSNIQARYYSLQETNEIHNPSNEMHFSATAAPHIDGMGRHCNSSENQFPMNQQVLIAKTHQHVIWKGF